MVLLLHVSLLILAHPPFESKLTLSLSVGALFFTMYFTELVRSEFTTWKSMALFCTLYIPYLVLMATMGLYGHARQIVKYSQWNPTARR